MRRQTYAVIHFHTMHFISVPISHNHSDPRDIYIYIFIYIYIHIHTYIYICVCVCVYHSLQINHTCWKYMCLWASTYLHVRNLRRVPLWEILVECRGGTKHGLYIRTRHDIHKDWLATHVFSSPDSRSQDTSNTHTHTHTHTHIHTHTHTHTHIHAHDTCVQSKEGL